MKKIISVLLIITMVLALTACGKSGGGASGKGSEIGFWAYESIEIDVDKYNKGLDASNHITAEDAEEYKSFYDMFLAGMYFEFQDGGKGILGYVVEDVDETPNPTEFTYANNKFAFPEEEDAGFKSYTIKDGKMRIIVESEDVKGLTLVCKKVDNLDEVKSNMQEILDSLNSLLNG